MPAHSSLPRTAACLAETEFAEAQDDWDGDATELYVIEPNVEAVAQTLVDNANIVPRQTCKHRKIKGLKSDATFSCSIYPTAPGVSAAEAAAATATIESTIMRAAVGGVDLGYCEGLAGGSASAPELEADPGMVAGDFGFFFDTSEGVGEFRRIESVAAAVLTLFEDLSFTPDVGGADVMHAVIDVYPNEDAIENHADANHVTLGWKVQGRDPEDAYELRGCKPTMGAVGIVAGEPTVIEFAHKVVTWAQTPAPTSWTSAPSGEAPHVPGVGATCSVRLGTFGGAMAEVAARGTITFTPGIEHEQDKGPNGTEGVHGYSGTIGDATLELTLEYDADYIDEFVSGALKHCMIQIGDTPTTAWAIYCPRLEYSAEPVRVDEAGMTSIRVTLRCLEDTASVSGLSGDDIDKRRAPWHLLFAA